MYAGSLSSQSWQNASIRIALELALFDEIVKSGKNDLSAEKLASKSNGDAVLIGMQILH